MTMRQPPDDLPASQRSEAVTFKPAEPTIDRLERWYALVYEIEQEARAETPEPEAGKSMFEPETLAEQVRQVAKPQALALNPDRMLHALWGHRNYRPLIACVLVNEDGSDVTLEEVGKAKPSVVGSAVVPFYHELLASLSTFDSGALAVGLGTLAQTQPTATA